MKKYRENYPNYIYALTMGLGKTILMATCIFYEFLLAKKYPRDKRFCHNALVFAPDKTVLQSLREIMTFDKTKVVPSEYARVLDSNIKFHFLDETGTILHTIDDSDFNIIISNTQKIIVKKKRKETSAAETLFSGSSSLLSAVYGAGGDDAYQRKLEKQWAPIKAQALSEIKNAKDAIQIQLKNEVVKSYTHSLMDDVDDLEQTIREAAPDDTYSLCEELLEKYTENSIPVSTEGNTDERARDNEKIRRVYKRVKQLFEKVKVIMTPPEKETDDKK